MTHIALFSTFQHHIHGNKIADLSQVNFPELVQKPGAEEAKAAQQGGDRRASEVRRASSSRSFLEGLSDAFLAERVAMPPGAEPPPKSRFEMLLSPKEHEMHHRGQLMMLQRMVGLVPHLTRQMQERIAAAAARPVAGARAMAAPRFSQRRRFDSCARSSGTTAASGSTRIATTTRRTSVSR